MWGWSIFEGGECIKTSEIEHQANNGEKPALSRASYHNDERIRGRSIANGTGVDTYVKKPNSSSLSALRNDFLLLLVIISAYRQRLCILLYSLIVSLP